MHPDKGVHVAARVAKAARIPLKVAAKMSEPHERRYFEEQVRPLLGGGVDYIGEVGGAEKLRLLGEATCLLNPIGWPEPFGMVMIEALATATPVITTWAGSAPEIVDDGVTGFLADDEQGLMTALAKVGDLDRRACRQAARQRFSAERMVAEHLAIYHSVAQATSQDSFAATPPSTPLSVPVVEPHPALSGTSSTGLRLLDLTATGSLDAGSSTNGAPAWTYVDGRETWASTSRSSNAGPSSS
jgi:hypothetical protein